MTDPVDNGSVLGVWGDITREGSIWAARGDTIMLDPRSTFLDGRGLHMVERVEEANTRKAWRESEFNQGKKSSVRTKKLQKGEFRY